MTQNKITEADKALTAKLLETVYQIEASPRMGGDNYVKDAYWRLLAQHREEATAELQKRVGKYAAEMLILAEQVDELVGTLTKLKYWAHWANEKLGFGEEPLFPEYKAADELLTKHKDKKNDTE